MPQLCGPQLLQEHFLSPLNFTGPWTSEGSPTEPKFLVNPKARAATSHYKFQVSRHKLPSYKLQVTKKAHECRSKLQATSFKS